MGMIGEGRGRERERERAVSRCRFRFLPLMICQPFNSATSPPPPPPATEDTHFVQVHNIRLCVRVCARAGPLHVDEECRKRFHATTLAVKERHSFVIVPGMFSEEKVKKKKNTKNVVWRRGHISLTDNCSIKFLVARIISRENITSVLTGFLGNGGDVNFDLHTCFEYYSFGQIL